MVTIKQGISEDNCLRAAGTGFFFRLPETIKKVFLWLFQQEDDVNNIFFCSVL